MKFKPFIKTKLRDPQSTDFSKHELVVNINEGSLFFKSNKGIHKLTESSATTTTTTTETTETTETTNSPWTTSENDIYYNTGKVGIGTPSPVENLEINGNIFLNTGNIRSNGDLNLLTNNNNPHAEDKAYINIKESAASTYINGDLNLVSNHTITADKQYNYDGLPTTTEWDIDNNGLLYEATFFHYENGYFNAGGIGNLTCEGDAAIGKFLTVGWSTTSDSTPEGATLPNACPLGSISAVGNSYASTHINTSDKKLKKNIEPIKDSLTKILSLEGKNYEWKDETKPGKQYGLIAQDVEKIIPELVTQGETKYLEYTGIIPVLIEAIKDQQKQIEELKSKIK